jgi:hypothetical protein
MARHPAPSEPLSDSDLHAASEFKAIRKTLVLIEIKWILVEAAGHVEVFPA